MVIRIKPPRHWNAAKPPAVSETGDPLLLTPGPLTTGKRVKEVMVHDWGSRDATFLKINSEVLTRLPEIVNGGGDYVTVPMQGSGTFAVEAMLTTFVPANGKVLLLINGAYGQRAKKILDIARRASRRARDAGGYAARSRRRSSACCKDAVDHAHLRGPLRDHVRHPQSDRRDRRAGAASTARAS